MSNLFFVLNSSGSSLCDNFNFLKVIYFGSILVNIVHIIIPIALIVFLIIDFTKCVINGDEANLNKIVKLSSKRIIAAVLVFFIPYVVSIFMSILSDFESNYSLCITKATAENIDALESKYEAEKKKKEEQKRNEAMYNVSSMINNSIQNSKYEIYHDFGNLMQCDPKWGNYPVCYKGKTICSSGCGYVSYTMVVRSFGNTSVTPDEIVDVACNDINYTNSAASAWLLTHDVLNNKYGLNARVIYAGGIGNSNKDAVISDMYDALENGESIILLIPNHWISILGLNDDGTVIVGDSYHGFAASNKYTLETLWVDTAVNFRFGGWHHVIAYSKK